MQLKLFIVFLVNFAAAMLLRVFLTPTLPTYAFNLLITGWGFVLFTLYKVGWLDGWLDHSCLDSGDNTATGCDAALRFPLYAELLLDYWPNNWVCP